MSIVAGQTILADDFIDESAGAADAGMGVKLNADGEIDDSMLPDSALASDRKDYVAYEAISAGQAVAEIFAGFAVNTLYSQTGHDTAKGIANDGSARAFGYANASGATKLIKKINFMLDWTQSPNAWTDGIFQVRQGTPDGTLLYNSGFSIGPPAYANNVLSFDNLNLSVANGVTIYVLVYVSNTGSGSALDLRVLNGGSHPTNVYTSNAARTVWTAETNNYRPYMVVEESLGSAGQIAKASALDPTSGRFNFIGFAVNGGSAGATITVERGKFFNGLSGMTPNADPTIYLADTQGAVSTSAGTYSRLLGKAISATTLQRFKDGRRVSPYYQGYSTDSGGQGKVCGDRQYSMSAAGGGNQTVTIDGVSVTAQYAWSGTVKRLQTLSSGFDSGRTSWCLIDL